MTAILRFILDAGVCFMKDNLYVIVIGVLSVILCVFILLLLASVLLAVCSIPVWFVCMIFGVKFSWLYASVLAVIVILVFSVIDIF